MTGSVPGRVVELAQVADEVMAIDRVRLRDGAKARSIREIFGIVRDVRGRRFDLIVDLHSLSESNLLAYLSGARNRLLADRENRSLNLLCNFRPRPPREDKGKHLTQRYMDVLRPLGMTGANREFRFAAVPADVQCIEQHILTDAEARYIGLFPGAGHPSRCWPLGSFAELAGRLAADGFTPVVFLGPEEHNMRPAVEELFSPDVKIAEGLSIAQFIAAAALLDGFVTNDTGPMHLAACAGAPVVLVMHEAAPRTYLPLTSRLAVVQETAIKDIPVDAVYNAFTGLLQGSENDKSAAAC